MLGVFVTPLSAHQVLSIAKARLAVSELECPGKLSRNLTLSMLRPRYPFYATSDTVRGTALIRTPTLSGDGSPMKQSRA